jgi:hypothetical protein
MRQVPFSLFEGGCSCRMNSWASWFMKRSWPVLLKRTTPVAGCCGMACTAFRPFRSTVVSLSVFIGIPPFVRDDDSMIWSGKASIYVPAHRICVGFRSKYLSYGSAIDRPEASLVGDSNQRRRKRLCWLDIFRVRLSLSFCSDVSLALDGLSRKRSCLNRKRSKRMSIFQGFSAEIDGVPCGANRT